MVTEQEREPFNLHRWAMQVARTASTRSTCDRKYVGAVLVNKDGELYSSGYNGAPRGAPHCTEKGHIIQEGHCIRIVHAEVNSILNATETGNGKQIEESTMYVTASPCHNCLLICQNARIKKIIYGEPYRNEILEELAKESGMEVTHIDNTSD